MTLKQQINADYMTAFKSKDVITKNLLSVVRGEIQTEEKNTGVENMSCQDIIKILTKTSKSLKEMSANGSQSAPLELQIIERYLPKQWSKQQITQKVTQLVNSGVTNIGSIMKEFSNLPVDKKMVSDVIKEIL